VTLTSGLIIVRGNPSSRNKKSKKFADYVLYWKPNVPVAIVEAKDNKHTVSQGLQQALRPLGAAGQFLNSISS
jgi:type I restriction enzyme R subunit